MRWRLAVTWAAVVIAMVALAATARAAPDAQRALAAEQTELGRAAFARGDDEEALRRFEQAFAFWPSPTILLNVAEVQLRLGASDKATEAFNHFLKMAGSDPAQAELVQHVRLRLLDLRRGVHEIDEDEGTVGPDGVRTPSAKPAPRAPYVAPIDDSMRAPVVEAIDDGRAAISGSRRDIYAPPPTPPAPNKKRVLAPWEIGLVTLGVVGGLVLTFAPVIYYTAPPLHPNIPIAFGGAPLR